MDELERQKFLNTLREDKNFAAAVREELQIRSLSDDMKALTSNIQQLTQTVEQLSETVGALGRGLDRRLDRIGDDLGPIKDHQLEGDLKAQPRNELRPLGAEFRRLRPLTEAEIGDLEIKLGLDETEAVRLSKTDLVAVVADETGAPARYVVVEASWRTGSEDVTRVVATRSILAKTGLPVVAIVFDEMGVAHPRVDDEIRAEGVTHLSRAA